MAITSVAEFQSRLISAFNNREDFEYLNSNPVLPALYDYDLRIQYDVLRDTRGHGPYPGHAACAALSLRHVASECRDVHRPLQGCVRQVRAHCGTHPTGAAFTYDRIERIAHAWQTPVQFGAHYSDRRLALILSAEILVSGVSMVLAKERYCAAEQFSRSVPTVEDARNLFIRLFPRVCLSQNEACDQVLDGVAPIDSSLALEYVRRLVDRLRSTIDVSFTR
jgi:hypothetical protein